MVVAVSQAASAPASGLSPMQAELLSRADSIFASIGRTVEKASDMAVEGGRAVAEQIPDIAYQYVAYGRAMETFALVLGFMFFITGLTLIIRYALKNAQNSPDDYWNDWGTSRVVAAIIGAFSSFIGFITIIMNIKGFILVWFAPKVWLLLELVNLIKIVKS